MMDKYNIDLIRTYNDKSPSPASLAVHLGLSIKEFEIALMRQDEYGNALRYLLTEILSWWERRLTYRNSLHMIRHIYSLLNSKFINEKQ